MLCDLVNSDEFGALKGTKLVAICPFSLILALFTSSKLLVIRGGGPCMHFDVPYISTVISPFGYAEFKKIGHIILPQCEQCTAHAFRQCALSRFKCTIDISASEGPRDLFLGSNSS